MSRKVPAGSAAPLPVAARHRGARRGIVRNSPVRGVVMVPRVGMTRRRALRGPGAPAGGRGRTETPPAKLSACDTCHCARTGALRTQGVHGHTARAGCTAHYSGGAMRTSRPTAKPHEDGARGGARGAREGDTAMGRGAGTRARGGGGQSHAPRWRAATGNGAAARRRGRGAGWWGISGLRASLCRCRYRFSEGRRVPWRFPWRRARVWRRHPLRFLEHPGGVRRGLAGGV